MPGAVSQVASRLWRKPADAVPVSGTLSTWKLTMLASLETSEIGADVGQLRARQIEIGHESSGLDRLRIVDPAGEIARRIWQSAGCQCPAAHEMRKIRRDRAASQGAPHRVTDPALGLEHVFALLQFGRTRSRSRLELFVQPSLKSIQGFGDHEESHVGMLLTAILGALAAVAARSVGLHPCLVDLPGNGLHLACERRHPEIMDDVGADQLDADWLADRYVEFIGGGEDLARVVVQVTSLPPELLAGDFDGERG